MCNICYMPVILPENKKDFHFTLCYMEVVMEKVSDLVGAAEELNNKEMRDVVTRYLADVTVDLDGYRKEMEAKQKYYYKLLSLGLADAYIHAKNSPYRRYSGGK